MSKTEVIPKNLVLIGFMGSGKSTVGRELHQRLGYPLVDMDQMIEKSEGKTIAQIFEEGGEQAFRDLETRQLEEIAGDTDQRHIISTGGGVIIRERNRELLRKLGYVVWLQAPEEVIHERTSRNQERPLLNRSDARERISGLLAEREAWYRQSAHLALDTAGLDSKEIATGILECARYFFRQPI